MSQPKAGWPEIRRLYDKILHWFYLREDRKAAWKFARRLPALLNTVDPNQEAILTHECWSLVKEIEGDLPAAIEHRATEIRLIKRLHRLSQRSPSREIVLKSYGHSDLSDRLDLLAGLYHDSGERDVALRVLRESQRLCKSKDIPFDGEEMLNEFLAEKQSARRLKSSA